MSALKHKHAAVPTHLVNGFLTLTHCHLIYTPIPLPIVQRRCRVWLCKLIELSEFVQYFSCFGVIVDVGSEKRALSRDLAKIIFFLRVRAKEIKIKIKSHSTVVRCQRAVIPLFNVIIITCLPT
jgi:hypothetical protein